MCVCMQMCVLGANGEALERAAGGRRAAAQLSLLNTRSVSYLTSLSRAAVDSDECGRWTRVWRAVCEVMTRSLAAALFANRAPSSAAAKAKNDPPTE
jgi:hypothetical protein